MNNRQLSYQSNSQKTSHQRRGSLYISVMGVTLIVSMIGFSAITIARVHLRRSQNSTDMVEAQKLAFSSVEYAVLSINNDPSWRTTFTNNIESPSTPIPLGNGTITFKLVDSDGNLADNTTDAVRLIGIGRVGEVEYAESVLLVPTGNGLTCLETALHCNGDVTLGFTVDLTTNQIISSNGSVGTGFLANLVGSAEAVGSISGSISGSSTTGITPRTMPGTDVFDYYKLNGTWIDINSLPVDGSSNPLIEKVVLSPVSNPFGSGTNLEGIYVIDCAGANIRIQNCRIEGTLVLINPGTSAGIRNSIYWESAVKNYPALLVEGNIEFRTTTAVLSESTLTTNFNPVGTPYETVSDSDTTDDYPSVIKGLVYVSGELELPADSLDTKVEGCIICNTIKESSDFIVNYYNTYRDYPPPGFAQGPAMAIVPGSHRRETLP